MLFDGGVIGLIRLIGEIRDYVYSQKRIWGYSDSVYGVGFDYRRHSDVA